MGFIVQKMEDEVEHHFKSEEIFISLYFLFELDKVEFFEDETLIRVAYRIYLCWPDQDPNL